jgi:tetratricopeptide (TPR) repeat protein
VLAALATFSNSLSAPFMFDDVASIQNNPTIRQLGTAWSPPPGGTGASGRPLVNFSLAVNYALGGTDVRGYHALNLAIHILAGLTLFGLVRRTVILSGPTRTIGDGGRGRRTPPQLGTAAYGDAVLQPDATLLAFTVALLWIVHPLQTETVTCVIQRTESIVGLCYLLTLYCFVRAVDSGRPRFWYVATVTACATGMVSKEVMVSAPLMVLLYDRTFVAGSFRGAWQRRWPFYLGLAGTWILLGFLMGGALQRGHAVGFGLGVSPWDYALTQCRAIGLYLKLSAWPHPLVVDYGTALVRNPMDVLLRGLLVVVLVGGTMLALWRRPVLGFAGAWFFAILAPSSSIVPLASQTIAEHRMYLPLAALITLAVLGGLLVVGRRGVIVFLALAAGLGWIARKRNQAYRSELSLWSDTVASCPGNVRARNNLGNALYTAGEIPAALRQYEEALRLQPESPESHLNLANSLVQLNRPAEAIGHCEAVLRLDPDSADAHFNLGNALARLGRMPEAIDHYRAALRTQPTDTDVHAALGAAFLKARQVEDAIREYAAALRLQPHQPEIHYGLATALMDNSDTMGAAREFAEAVRLNPAYVEAHFALGNILAGAGQIAAAIDEYKQVLLHAPDHVMARNNLGNALLVAGRVDEAIIEYQEVLRVHPDDASVRENLEEARALQRAPRPAR